VTVNQAAIQMEVCFIDVRQLLEGDQDGSKNVGVLTNCG
jgi:hypothetical protein